jgi:hypothetical protein
MKKVTRVLALAALAVVAGAKAEAAPIIYVDPVPVVVEVGEAFSVDIWIKDLLETIGAFDVDMAFNDTILAGTGFTVDPDGNFVNDFGGLLSLGFSANLVNIAEAGDPAGNNLALAPFKLGTINFTASALGNTLLTFPYHALSNDPGGSPLLANSVQPGIVCVVDDKTAPVNCAVRAVPEPGFLALIGVGLGAFVARRRRTGSPA